MKLWQNLNFLEKLLRSRGLQLDYIESLLLHFITELFGPNYLIFPAFAFWSIKLEQEEDCMKVEWDYI